jgi:hypothetical protein
VLSSIEKQQNCRFFSVQNGFAAAAAEWLGSTPFLFSDGVIIPSMRG